MCIQVYSSRLLVGVKGYQIFKLKATSYLVIKFSIFASPLIKKTHSFPYFLSEAIMNRHEIDIEDLSQGGRRGLI